MYKPPRIIKKPYNMFGQVVRTLTCLLICVMYKKMEIDLLMEIDRMK